MKNLLQSKFVFPLIFIFSLSVFLAHTAVTGTAVFSDAKYYFSYTHSLVKDHDLNNNNEYQFYGFGTASKDKLIPNFYPPGVSLFWIPYQNSDAGKNIAINNGAVDYIPTSRLINKHFLGVSFIPDLSTTGQYWKSVIIDFYFLSDNQSSFLCCS
jgi:hypothetical protein